MPRRFRQGAYLNLPRVLVVAAAAVSFTALGAVTWVGLHRLEPAPRPVALAIPHVLPPQDLRLARCQALGEAGARDEACLRIWAAVRARFLGSTHGPAAAPRGED